jgi:glyoxylase-like metal-dependent hydrolase (beta-lactamase superfamily II)
MEAAYRITDNVSLLGNAMIPVYLITGSKLCVLIDTGMTMMGPVYTKEIIPCLTQNKIPLYVFLTHSHYDHLGSASYLKRHLPEFKIGGYYTIDNILKSSHAVELITSLNHDSEKMMNINDPDIEFRPFQLDMPLTGGEHFDIGGDDLEVIYTPGHTKDSMCYYLKNRSIMFTGEAAGIRLQSGDILPEFLTSYKSYVSSLKILTQYHVDYIATGHGPVIEGEEARQYFMNSIKETQVFIERIRAYYKESGNINDVVERIKNEDYVKSGSGQPERAYTINLQAKVRAVIEDK